MTSVNRWIIQPRTFYSSDEEVKAARHENTKRHEEFLRAKAAAEAKADAMNKRMAEVAAMQKAEAARRKAMAEAEVAKRMLAEAKAAKKARIAVDKKHAEELKRYYEGVAIRDADKQRLKELCFRQSKEAKRAYALRLFHLHGKPVRCLLCGCDMSSWRPVCENDDPICDKCSGIGTRYTSGVYNGNLRDPFHEHDDYSGGDSGWDLAVRRCEE